ncbi:MAG TPA: paraquat-inducible protein A, partial [Burkholderiaceae bacterium]|nr:paraquat-inducible protein A [Burkholderiaceae bacterium]
PAGVLTLRAYVLGYLMFHRVPPGFRIALRLLALTQRWGMIEVFLLGVLVALVRLAGLATFQARPGLTAFAVFTVLITSVEAGGLHRLWDWLDQSSPTRETA